MLRQLICQVIGHRVNRRRVWQDGMDLRGSCRVCRIPLIRGRYAWRPFDTSRDADRKRNAHPRSG